MKTARIGSIVLGLLMIAVVGNGCGGPVAPSSGSVDVGPVPTAAIEWDMQHMTIADWTNDAQLIVAGAVTRVDSPRWNSKDGKKWSPSSESQLAVVYQTFCLQPEIILKGEPGSSAPVAMRVVWNTSTGTGPLKVGDQVVAFAYHDDGLYGGGTYQPPDAYWLLSENALYIQAGEDFVHHGVIKDPAESVLSLGELVKAIGKNHVVTTQEFPVRETAAAAWGEAATAGGVLEVTATRPQRDPSARTAESSSDIVVLYCTVTIKDVGTTPRKYDENWFSLTSDAGVGSDGNDTVQPSAGPALGRGTLQPGESVTGTVPFQCFPEDAEHIKSLTLDTYQTWETEQPVVRIVWAAR